MEEKHFYHAATKGLDNGTLFSSREQFIAGMNRVAFSRLTVPEVIVIAFVLMDNHVHFILHGTYTSCMKFMAQYRRLTEIWLSHNCPSEGGKCWEYDCWPIPNWEKLQEKICYVLRNPLAAGMNILPTSYRWSSGPLMFSESPVQHDLLKRVGETSEYRRRKDFGTKLEIPPEWLVTDYGMIWPGSYTEYRRAEQVFGGIVNFMYELNRKNEDLINQEMYGNEISLPDSDVKAILEARSLEEFSTSSLSLLTVPERLDLCRSVRKSHGVGIKQLARVLHIKHSDLKKIW